MKPVFASLKSFRPTLPRRDKKNNIPPKEKRFSWRAFLKKSFQLSLYAGAVVVLFIIGVFAFYTKDLPNPDKINARQLVESTKIYDRTGEHLLYEIHGEEKRTLIPLDQMPDTIKYATIALEDQDFYRHRGIKFSSILRAALKDALNRGTTQGGSTITQQFIKNSILSPEKSFTRKVKEVILAFEMEQKFSKDEILQMYLNEIPYGSNAYGIEAAAQTFFGKPAREITLAQSCLLASLPKAPSRFSPYGSSPERLKARQEHCLNQMASLGYISQEESSSAKGEDIFEQLAPHRESIQAPHFVMYVKDYLEEKYGEDTVEKGGLQVFTTLDWEMQKKAEEIVSEGALENEKKWNASNAALLAMSPKTGQILAMVGSRDYFEKEIDGQVNVAIRPRQPGSSFKPYVYLTAFQKGYTPETILFDVETDFETESGKEYTPRNYDGKFRGPVKIKEALGMSLNIPAVKTLYLAGIEDSINTARALGITTLQDRSRYGLSLVLGGGEVLLLDHVNAFGTLANGGVKIEKTALLKVLDNTGAVLEEFKDRKGERVVDEKYVTMLDHILSTNKYRAPTFGENNWLKFEDGTVAAKTGTTNEFRDGWLIGYTPSLVVGVWTGNNDNSPMQEGAAGANTVGPLWRKFMDAVLINYPKEKFPEYRKEEYLTGKEVIDGEIDLKKEIKICKIPSKDRYCLPTKYCPEERLTKKEFFTAHSILHYVNRADPLGEYPNEKNLDPQYAKWEKAVRKWAEKEKYITDEPPDKECSQDDFDDYLPKIDVSLGYTAGLHQLSIRADPDAPYGGEEVAFFVDGEKIGERGSKPFTITYEIPSEKNNSTLSVTVRVTDKNDNEARSEKKVDVSF